MWKILYVDDEEDIRSIAQMAIELDDDIRVRTLDNPRRTIEAAVECQADLALLDFRMPQMDVLAVLRELRSDNRTRDLPVVFITASVQKHELDGLIEAGANGVIEKPFDPMVLSKKVRQFLESSSRS